MMIPKAYIGALIALALVGFSDSAFLTAEHIRGSVPPCTVVQGCEQVLTSTYATFAGIPVAAFGMLYYGTLLVMLLAYVDTLNRKILHVACWLTGAGLLGTLYFLAVQAFILSAFCLYCLASAASSILLFIIAVRIMRMD
jgi:uncharacterized membrane protein